MAPEHRDDRCPICTETFLSILALEEMAEAMDTPAMSPYDQGVTKLSGCGHKFCRKDLTKWIISARKDTCPVCRAPMGLPTSPPPSSPPNANGTASGIPPQFAHLVSPELDGYLRSLLSGGSQGQASADGTPALPREDDTTTHERDMLQQMMEAMARSQVPRPGGGTPAGMRTTGLPFFGNSPYQQEEDDRQEYSGMYS